MPLNVLVRIPGGYAYPRMVITELNDTIKFRAYLTGDFLALYHTERPVGEIVVYCDMSIVLGGQKAKGLNI